MAYVTTNPPGLAYQLPAGGRKHWIYTSEDAVTLVRVSGYFTNGWQLGMRAGDTVTVLDNNASPLAGALCWVTSATSTAVDLSDGVAITDTDSD